MDAPATLLLDDGRLRTTLVLVVGSAVPETGGGPMYRDAVTGEPAIPTGRLFVRFADGRADAHRDDLAAAGFEIVTAADYAPEAAWILPLRGGIAAALNALPAIASISGVAHVEPELLRRRR
jgi:hypothetical protein